MTTLDEIKTNLESNHIETMWEVSHDILMKVSGTLYEAENFDKVFSPFLLCRYISMKKNLIEYAEILNTVNSNSRLSKKQFYIFAYSLIPKQKSGYIKYIKKLKKEKVKKEETSIEIDLKSNIFEI